MRKAIWVGAFLIGVAVLGGTSLVQAGYGWPGGEVTVTKNADGSGSAGGNLRVARLSFDNRQHIGCTIKSEKLVQRLDCNASNAAGLNASCTTTDAVQIRTATALQPDSQLSFSFDRSGYCTAIATTMSSLSLH